MLITLFISTGTFVTVFTNLVYLILILMLIAAGIGAIKGLVGQ